MKKLLIPLLFGAAALAGCAQLQNLGNTITTLTGTSVSAQQISIAASSFDALENAGATYLGLPLCGSTNTKATPVCRQSAASSQIYKALIAGRQARNQLEAQVASGGTGSVSLYNTLVTAISTLQTLIPSK